MARLVRRSIWPTVAPKGLPVHLSASSQRRKPEWPGCVEGSPRPPMGGYNPDCSAVTQPWPPRPAWGSPCPVPCRRLTLVVACSEEGQQLLVQAERLQHDLAGALVEDGFLETATGHPAAGRRAGAAHRIPGGPGSPTVRPSPFPSQSEPKTSAHAALLEPNTCSLTETPDRSEQGPGA